MKYPLKHSGTQGRRLCAIVLAALIAFSFAACGDNGDPSSPATSLSGSVHISTAQDGAAVTEAYIGQTLYAVYSGSETGLTYQWKLNGENIAAGTKANYTPTETGEYTVSVSAAGYTGNALSSGVSVSEGNFPGSVHISKTYGGAAVSESLTGETLYAVYEGSAEGLIYRWKKDGVDIPGGTQASCTPAPLANGLYTVSVSAAGYTGGAQSSGVTVGFPPLSGNVHISAAANGAALTEAYIGQALYAVYEGSETDLSYQWKKDGIDVSPNGTDVSYTPTEAGKYCVSVSKAGYQSVTAAEVSATPAPDSYEIGETGPGGGIIFYYSEEGFTMADTGEILHYLEAAPHSAVSSQKWGYYGVSLGLTDMSIGVGRKHTDIMGVSSPAAKHCLEYSNNGKDDWFLPGWSELYQLWDNDEIIALGSYDSGNYYTSTEGGSVSASYFIFGGTFGGYNKDYALKVLPIRAF